MRRRLADSKLLQVDPEHPDRWWTRLVFWHVVLVMLWIAGGLILTSDFNIDHRYTAAPAPPPQPGQPRQHPISSLGAVRHLLHITWLPWDALAWAFLALVVALLWSRTRAWAFLIGAAVAALFVGFVVAYTYVSGSSTNQVTVPLSTLVPDALFAGFRYAKLPPRNGTARRETA